MKNVLILTYYYPPCNITASNRIDSWVEYFKEFGLSPTVITRKWEQEVLNPEDEYIASSSGTQIEDRFGARIIYTEYSPLSIEKSFSEALSGFNLIAYKLNRLLVRLKQKRSISAYSYYRIYEEARKHIKENSVDYLMVSAFPYGLFHMAYKLKEEFPEIKWIADYRDDWSTNSMVLGKSIFYDMLLKYESRYEKKWLKKSALITTASDSSHKLRKLHSKPVQVIYNGHRINKTEDLSSHDNIKLIYSGSLYSMQDFTLLKDGLDLLAKDGIRPELVFLGGTFNVSEHNKLSSLFKQHPQVRFTDRLASEAYLRELKSAHAFILSPYADIPEITPSKMFDYFGLEKPIFLIPSDHGEMERFLELSGLGNVCHSGEEFKNAFVRLLRSDFKLELSGEQRGFLAQFHRKAQTKKLAELILNI